MSVRLAYRAFAKINLGLEVVGKRPDGYHDIRTMLQSIAVCDLIEVHPSSTLSLTCSDPVLPAGDDNLIIRAAKALQEAHSCEKGARINLTKRIPTQAGLGGGSSDAAATLVALSKLWHLPSDLESLMPMAASLGSDVPFFLVGGTALGVSRGEEVYALPDAPSMHMVIAQPQRGMPTAEAYRLISEKLTTHNPQNKIAALVLALVEGRLSERLLFNAFESVNRGWGEESESVRSALVTSGSAKVLLAGSGSAWVGLFPDRESSLAAQRRMVQRGYNAICTSTITRKHYWEQTIPTRVKE